MSSEPEQKKLNVLVVLSSHEHLGNTGKKTGWYLPYVNFTVASPRGGNAPLDPNSIEAFKTDEACTRFLNEKKHLWEKSEMLFKFMGKASQFDALFYVGGHGPMFDLVTDPASLEIIKQFYEKGKIVSAVCHGPAVFVNVTLANGEHLLHDQPVTGFSDFEEDAVGLLQAMPFSLETELSKKSRGRYEKADEPWGPKVVVGRGGRLITGQNPASAGPIARELLKQLGVGADQKIAA
ncbi:hypothetical protein ABW20_dc0100750 [Dactylellina cionopaga]|nr:hypothetical protein ABW20_dc0100750 [Dactylellina cionopaga]